MKLIPWRNTRRQYQLSPIACHTYSESLWFRFVVMVKTNEVMRECKIWNTTLTKFWIGRLLLHFVLAARKCNWLLAGYCTAYTYCLYFLCSLRICPQETQQKVCEHKWSSDKAAHKIIKKFFSCLHQLNATIFAPFNWLSRAGHSFYHGIFVFIGRSICEWRGQKRYKTREKMI